ncbi:serine--tRNA ligase [Candidatus Woesearchaeota archaeon]|nr:MAG: serine--tRNA ligase [Candidatus Woesearchaeota archaeon]
MLSLKTIREETDRVRKNIERKKDAATLKILDELLMKDAEWRKHKVAADKLRAERNKLSEAINAAKKRGEDATKLIVQAKKIPAQIKAAEEAMERLMTEEIKPRLRKIPNFMHPDVPYGKDDSENPEVKRHGTPRAFTFPVKNHVELCEALGLADFEASGRTSGNGFYFLKGDLALLNQALIQYAIGIMRKHGYTYIEPPLMVRKRILDAAMDTDGFEATIYRIEGDDLALIGTSEHAILGMLDGQVLPEDELPLKLFAYSMCFRQEIGSHGINEKGLWRTHQFNKVEMFQFTKPEESWDAYDEMLSISEEIMQGLQLPYRVIECCTGDLALWKARSMDVEVWRPTTKSYGEVMSLSNCTDYQARDLGIKLLRKNGTREVVHTLNNTALATSRIMVAILENYQNEDGSITVPEALRGSLGRERLGTHS